jgi:DNA-3-methyladenine glycosylase II
MTFTIVPDTEYSLDAAAAFGFGPNTGRPVPERGVMRLAFVADDLAHHVGVVVHQDPAGNLTASVEGDVTTDQVEPQVRRILSLDRSGAEWLAVGEGDHVIGDLQRLHAGLRPVLFHSPYEAAAWSILSLRRQRTQAAHLRARIAAAHGRMFVLSGETVHAFPTPDQLLALNAIEGVDQTRLERLHSVARHALDGYLEPVALQTMEPQQAIEHLAKLPGIGPTYATLILLRASGTTDAMTLHEPRLPSYTAHFYHLNATVASADELRMISEAWRPYRTWAAVLIRVAGDRQGLPYPIGGDRVGTGKGPRS